MPDEREEDAADLAEIKRRAGEPTIPYEQLRSKLMDPKPGIKTTEFWTALIGIAATAIPGVISLLAGHPTVAAILGAAAVVLPTVYIWGRAVLKAEAAKETDVIPDGWEGMLDSVLEIAKVLAEGAASAQAVKPAEEGKDSD